MASSNSLALLRSKDSTHLVEVPEVPEVPEVAEVAEVAESEPSPSAVAYQQLHSKAMLCVDISCSGCQQPFLPPLDHCP